MGRARQQESDTGVRGVFARDAFVATFGSGRGLSAAQQAEADAREAAPRPFVDEDGTVNYYRGNNPQAAVLHRVDGPALVGKNEDGEDIEEWYLDGELHRENGPATVAVSADGTIVKHYYWRGQLHREGGPTRIETRADGTLIEHWHREGKLHREDGPAIRGRYADGTETIAFYLEGVQVEG
jgi:hypothetical protein